MDVVDEEELSSLLAFELRGFRGRGTVEPVALVSAVVALVWVVVVPVFVVVPEVVPLVDSVPVVVVVSD